MENPLLTSFKMGTAGPESRGRVPEVQPASGQRKTSSISTGKRRFYAALVFLFPILPLAHLAFIIAESFFRAAALK